MNKERQYRGTSAYLLGYKAFRDAESYEAGEKFYFPGDNLEAWRLGWTEAQAEKAARAAQNPEERMRGLLNTIRDCGYGYAHDEIAEALEMLWERLKP